MSDSFQPFPAYKGALALAMGDFDGDGNDELVVGKATGTSAAFTKANGGISLAFGKVRNATFATTGFPQTIQDFATLNSQLFVPAGAGRIVDLDITIALTHTFDNDLGWKKR
jgi:hypothetical protein